MLSNCQQGKYHHPDLCAVNPTYKVMHDKLRWPLAGRRPSRLSDTELDTCDAGVLPCNDWEPSEELQPLTLELTFSRQVWRQALSTGHGLPRELLAQIQS